MRPLRKRIALVLAALMVFAAPLYALGAEPNRAAKQPAIVIVRLPAAAELFIGGFQSKRHTALREFDTPPLARGKKFSYLLKAVWKDGVKEVTHVRTIFVKAGETTEIDLLGWKWAPPSAEKLPAPELMPQ